MATPIPRNHAPFTLAEVARATGGHLVGDPDACARGVTIDSRAVEAGNLFVAIEGEHHDGHAFVERALSAGGVASVVRRSTGMRGAHVEVEDTLRALGDLAALHRSRWGGRVVVITGSAGKTSTKELVAAALRGAGLRVLRTEGNLNNLIGLPMTAFGLDESVDVAVLEAGTSKPGEIARLAEVARPDVGVVTLVAAAHTEGLGSVENVGEEKGALFMALGPSGHAVANGDDDMVRAWAQRCPAQRVSYFGAGEGADVRLLEWSLEPELRTRCVVALPGREPLVVRLRLLGEAAAMNAAAALAVCSALGADVDAAAAALEEVAPPDGRMRPLAGARDTLVLDDSYNANPRSVVFALDTAAALAQVRDGRVVAVLGDMKELGERAAADHRAVCEHAAAVGVAVLVCIGDAMGQASDAAARRGVKVVRVASSDEAAELLPEVILEGDVVLVKGSRSMRTERVARALHEGEGVR
jgi:UDP-N-acetylmuramoyl-tripeptide--D-alanyl-D-alanine ligase